MTQEEQQVRAFYEVIWNQHDTSVIADVLHADFIFRGSLGVNAAGHADFVEYLDMIHTALDDYQCHIKELITEPLKVFAKMQFSGVHRGVFMGVAPTAKRLSWDGAALFHFKGDKISSLWVLGDLKSLEAQLQYK